MTRWLTLAQVKARVGRSGTWVRHLCATEVLVSRHDSGVLEISSESVTAYIQAVKEEENRKRKRLKDELDGKHERPSTRACNMLRRKVQKDKRLTDQERAFLVSKIDQYAAEWDAAYQSRQGE
jgi:hypothetical protein